MKNAGKEIGSHRRGRTELTAEMVRVVVRRIVA